MKVTYWEVFFYKCARKLTSQTGRHWYCIIAVYKFKLLNAVNLYLTELISTIQRFHKNI